MAARKPVVGVEGKWKPSKRRVPRSYKTADGRTVEIPNWKFYAVNQSLERSGRMASNGVFDTEEEAIKKAGELLRNYVSMRFEYLLPVLVVQAPNKTMATLPLMAEGNFDDVKRRIVWINGKATDSMRIGAQPSAQQLRFNAPGFARKSGLARGETPTPAGMSGGLKRFTEGVMTEEEWVSRYAREVEQYQPSPYSYFNRTKFNRMDHGEQAEYEKKLRERTAKPHYRAWHKSKKDTFVDIGKRTFDKVRTGKLSIAGRATASKNMKLVGLSTGREIHVGDKLWFTTPHGTKSGVVKLIGTHGPVVALSRKFGGGKWGTPVVVDEKSIIQVVKGKRPVGAGRLER